MKRWQLWLGIVISLIFLWLALRGLELAKVWAALQSAHFIWLAPGVALYFLAVWARTWRWHYLLRPLTNDGQRISLRTLFPIVTIGYMGNNVYPARIGEVLRAYVLKRKAEVPVSASLATIIVERIFDGVVMLTFVFFNLPALARVSGESRFAGSIQSLALVGAAAFSGALLVFLLAALFPRPSLGLYHRFVSRLLPPVVRQPVGSLLERFWQGLESLRSPASILMVFLTSIVVWLLETGKYWFVLHAFPGMSSKVNFFALMLMNGIVNLATTLPSAPGYVGTFDAPGIAVLMAYGVEATLAAAYTLVLHAALWLPITLLGFYYFGRESLAWGKVQSEWKSLEPTRETSA